MKLRRYRLRAWLKYRPNQELKLHLSLKCKVCAMGRAMDLAQTLQNTAGCNPDDVEWTVEAIDGHLTGWAVIARSKHIPELWVRRHGH